MRQPVSQFALKGGGLLPKKSLTLKRKLFYNQIEYQQGTRDKGQGARGKGNMLIFSLIYYVVSFLCCFSFLNFKKNTHFVVLLQDCTVALKKISAFLPLSKKEMRKETKMQYLSTQKKSYPDAPNPKGRSIPSPTREVSLKRRRDTSFWILLFGYFFLGRSLCPNTRKEGIHPKGYFFLDTSF